MRSLVRTLLVAALLAALATTFAFAQDPVSLGLKFTENEAVNYNVSFSGSGSLVAPDGQRATLLLQGSFTLLQTAVQVQQDGSAVLETLLPKADLTITVKDQQARFSYADGKLRWFAQGKEQTPPQQDLSKLPLLAIPVRITTKPDGSITGIAFADTSFLDMLQKVAPSLATSLPSLPAINTSPLLPATPVRIGESWSKNEALPLPTGDSATYRTRRTLDSVTGSGNLQLAKLSGFAETRYRGKPSTIAGPGGQSVTISIPDLRQTLASTEFFNIGRGRLVRGDYDMQFATQVSATVAGTTQGGKVEARLLAIVQEKTGVTAAE